MVMKKLLIIALLVVGCSDDEASTEPEDPLRGVCIYDYTGAGSSEGATCFDTTSTDERNTEIGCKTRFYTTWYEDYTCDELCPLIAEEINNTCETFVSGVSGE